MDKLILCKKYPKHIHKIKKFIIIMRYIMNY